MIERLGCCKRILEVFFGEVYLASSFTSFCYSHKIVISQEDACLKIIMEKLKIMKDSFACKTYVDLQKIKTIRKKMN